MRTLILVGVATAAVIVSDPVDANPNPYPQRVVVKQIAQSASGDSRVYVSDDDRVLTEAEYRERWSGDWNGQWAADGSYYQGSYQGIYRPEYRAPVSYEDRRDDRYDYDREESYGYDRSPDWREDDGWDNRDMERRCSRPATATGAVAGGLIGGIAGNRIAGSGNRTKGTIIGGVVGAVAGAAIGSAADRQRCERWWSSQGYSYDRQGDDRGRYPQQPAYSYAQQQYGYAPQGYYYAYAAPMVTTVIIEGGDCGCQQVTTETVTTEYEYETVYEQPAKRVSRTYARPAPVKRVKRQPIKGKRVYRK